MEKIFLFLLDISGFADKYFCLLQASLTGICGAVSLVFS